MTDLDETDWAAVSGRAMAMLALSNAGLEKATVLERAEFLDRLGMRREETAALLGTTKRSLRELERQRDKRSKR